MRNAGWDSDTGQLVVPLRPGQPPEEAAAVLGLRRNAEFVRYVEEVRKAAEALPPIRENVRETVHFYAVNHPKEGALIRYYESPASAGNGKMIYDDLEKYINVSKRYHPDTFFISITGDSLKNIGITEHHRLLIDPTIDAKNNMFVLAKINDNFVVKRYKTNGATLLLCPENPEYEPMPFTPDTQIIGVVVECILPMLP
jgi:phage repressor protein C with HTH and peptisase S24 domain